MKLKAVRSLKYETRQMEAGDVFEVPNNKAGRLHRSIFLARRLARDVREPAVVPPPPPHVAEKIAAATGTVSLPGHPHGGPPPGTKIDEPRYTPPKPAPASRPLPATAPTKPKPLAKPGG